jgi:hypothetical protein
MLDIPAFLETEHEETINKPRIRRLNPLFCSITVFSGKNI